MTISFKHIFFLTIGAFMMGSCSSSDDSDSSSVDGFDREAMLTNWADNIIIPAYESFKTEVDELKSASENFKSTPNEENLNNLRQKWEDAYISYQNVELFLTGPADEFNVTNRRFVYLNAFPTSAETIEDNISSGSYDLTLGGSRDEQGFPALDYLLFGLGDTDAEILEFYTTNSNANNYINYLSDVVERIDSITTSIVSGWNGDYRNDFVLASGSSASSSVDVFVNDYLRYYERFLRSYKIRIPSGVETGTISPDQVEAFYKNNLSKTLFLGGINAFKNLFIGKHFDSNETGASLKSYLDQLNIQKNGQSLSDLIVNQFDATISAANNLDDSFVNQINNDNSALVAVNDELERNVIYLKSDMVSAMSISITFNSNDGD